MTRKSNLDPEWKRRGRGDGRRPLVFAAAVTPFRNGAVEETGFEENLRFEDAFGMDGILVAGTTGEASRLDGGTRDRLIAIAAECLAPECLIMAGTRPRDPSAEATIADIAACRVAGADCVLVAPPVDPANPRRDESEVAAWFDRVTKAAALPVLAYHAPSFKAHPLRDETIRAIRSVGKLAGVKDSLGDDRLMRLWLERNESGFGVFVGSPRLFKSMGREVTGAILGIASVRPEPYAAMARLHGEGRPVDALAESLEEDLRRVESGRIVALKEMLEELGLFGGEMDR